MNATTVDLDKLAIGDEVAWLERNYVTTAAVGKVVRFTATQIVVEADGFRLEQRFYRKNGCMVKTYGTYLQKPTDGDIVNALSRKAIGDLYSRIANHERERSRRRQLSGAADVLGALVEIEAMVIVVRAEVSKRVAALDAADGAR